MTWSSDVRRKLRLAGAQHVRSNGGHEIWRYAGKQIILSGHGTDERYRKKVEALLRTLPELPRPAREGGMRPIEVETWQPHNADKLADHPVQEVVAANVADPSQAIVTAPPYRCLDPECDRQFSQLAGRGKHCKRAHPALWRPSRSTLRRRAQRERGELRSRERKAKEPAARSPLLAVGALGASAKNLLAQATTAISEVAKALDLTQGELIIVRRERDDLREQLGKLERAFSAAQSSAVRRL